MKPIVEVSWDEDVLDRMSRKASAETLEAKAWVLSHQELSLPFINAVQERHPAVWFGMLMEEVSKAIKMQDEKAIRLGCFYIIQDPKAPFGRIMKRKILNALRRVPDKIPDSSKVELADAQRRMIALPYPPQELKDLKRLMRILGAQGNKTGDTP